MRLLRSIVFLFYWLRPEWGNAFSDRFIIVIQIRGAHSCQQNHDVNSCPKQVNSSHLTFARIYFWSRKQDDAIWLKWVNKCTFSLCFVVRRKIREKCHKCSVIYSAFKIVSWINYLNRDLRVNKTKQTRKTFFAR